jgi:hypothetical protein
MLFINLPDTFPTSFKSEQELPEIARDNWNAINSFVTGRLLEMGRRVISGSLPRPERGSRMRIIVLPGGGQMSLFIKNDRTEGGNIYVPTLRVDRDEIVRLLNWFGFTTEPFDARTITADELFALASVRFGRGLPVEILENLIAEF